MSQNAELFSSLQCHLRQRSQVCPSMHFEGGDVHPWQETLRRKLVELLGPAPIREGSLNVQEVWRRAHPLGEIHRIHFTSERDCLVPAYLCLPRTKPPYRVVICLQGHSTGMHRAIGVSRTEESLPPEEISSGAFGLQCMQRGLAALCVEQRAFGERSSNEDGTPSCYLPAMQALMLGKTILAERIHDIDCAIDYLESRDDIVMEKLAVMGNSGGGTAALFSAALLPRIKMALCGSSFCTFWDSIMATRHCVCNYVPNLLNFAEMADIAGLVAPRPLVLVNGDEDKKFPISGSLDAFRHLKEIYSAIGAPHNCQIAIGSGGHRFYESEGWDAFLPYLNH